MIAEAKENGGAPPLEGKIAGPAASCGRLHPHKITARRSSVVNRSDRCHGKKHLHADGELK
jgi:hypothetical protein